MRIYKVIIGLLLASLLFFLLSCSKTDKIATKELNYEHFSSINVKDYGNVSIVYGNTQNIVIKGDESFINNISNEVVNDELLIQNNSVDFTNVKAEYIITVPEIKKLSIEGISSATIGDFKQTNQLSINIEGNGDVKINDFESIQDINIDASGNAQVEILSNISELENINIKASGNLDFLGYLTQTQRSNIDYSGAGSIKIWVKEVLNTKITGSGTIFYKGYPTINESETSLANGKIIDQN